MKHSKSKSGHAEIIGETIAKFELFENDWNPYTRFLDVDKVDILLRRNVNGSIYYREVQVKFGKLHEQTPWEQKVFETSSWRFFNPTEFDNSQNNLFILYVLSRDTGYKGDLFIFPIKFFKHLIRSGILSNTRKGEKRKIYLSKLNELSNSWILRKQNSKSHFSKGISNDNSIDITKYYRAFDLLD